jgi:PKHD-type hydroxylase
VDGKLSAGMAAQRVKNNTEMAADESRLEGLNALVMGALVRHPLYQHAALPHRVATPFYARYAPGRSYGDHVDDPVMGSEHRYRSDVSITIFLSAPEDYAGGELIIETSFGNQKVKSPAGDAVLYPSSSRHRVAEVTGGERLVAVTWAQSLVRDAARRELLFELGQARDRLLARSPDAAETRQVDKSYVNLLRMWAEL